MFETADQILDALQAYKGEFFLQEDVHVRHKSKAFWYDIPCCPLAVILCEKTGIKECNIGAPNKMMEMGVPKDVIQEILTGADREQSSPIRTRLLALCS